MYQRIKKINAVLGLLTIVLLIAHAGYNAFCYLTMYYNPVLKQVLSLPLMIAVCLHAVLGMSMVFINRDGGDLSIYSEYNKGTILQRISAALILPILFIHIKTFALMSASAESGERLPVFLLILVEIFFFGVVFTHIAISFSRTLITLGLLADMETKKKLDKFMYIFCALLFIICIIAIARTQIFMFAK